MSALTAETLTELEARFTDRAGRPGAIVLLDDEVSVSELLALIAAARERDAFVATIKNQQAAIGALVEAEQKVRRKRDALAERVRVLEEAARDAIAQADIDIIPCPVCGSEEPLGPLDCLIDLRAALARTEPRE